jgi:hypothetical protein
MSRRTSVIVASTVGLLVVGLGVWFLIAGAQPDRRSPRTWIVQDGTTRSFSAGRIVEGDRFRCSDGVGIDAVPSPGHGVGGSGGISVTTNLDGSVTVECATGPPGNA